jgi:hypothetical protein
MIMPAGNSIDTMLPRGGSPARQPSVGGDNVPPQVKQEIMELIAAIQRDPENAMQYMQLAKERYGIDLQQIAQGM